MSCPVPRVFPLRQPKNYRPPVPRWQLKLPAGVEKVFTIYVGIQWHSTDLPTSIALAAVAQEIEEWITAVPPLAHEIFNVEDGDDKLGSKVHVCYYTDVNDYENSVKKLSLVRIYQRLDTSKKSIGLWCERFSTDTSRLETNYSGLDYHPGLGMIPGSKLAEHTYSAYWGAARDRIPDSAHDTFKQAPDVITAFPSLPPKALGQHLRGKSYENMVHIRSGQYWENCNKEESDSYETILAPTLKKGLDYLWENPEVSGTVGFRFLRNEGVDGKSLKETCGAGFFRSLADLETWSEKHPSHKAIYLGAIKHAKTFGDSRKMRTWHEVSILRSGDAHFEYLNCHSRTGVIAGVGLESETM